MPCVSVNLGKFCFQELSNNKVSGVDSIFQEPWLLVPLPLNADSPVQLLSSFPDPLLVVAVNDVDQGVCVGEVMTVQRALKVDEASNQVENFGSGPFRSACLTHVLRVFTTGMRLCSPLCPCRPGPTW